MLPSSTLFNHIITNGFVPTTSPPGFPAGPAETDPAEARRFIDKVDRLLPGDSLRGTVKMAGTG
jgi:hypothetical protein